VAGLGRKKQRQGELWKVQVSINFYQEELPFRPPSLDEKLFLCFPTKKSFPLSDFDIASNGNKKETFHMQLNFFNNFSFHNLRRRTPGLAAIRFQSPRRSSQIKKQY
jgi:hypothetical protein